MSGSRSNVQARSNVNIRSKWGVDAEHDRGFTVHLRTFDSIREVFPMVWNAVGIDWGVARAVLTPFQLTVISEHHPCSTCKRWDRWPIYDKGNWQLSRTEFGCLCERERKSSAGMMSSPTPTGYDSWADLYDELYESAFGAMYSSMTAAHLRLVADRHSKVVDVGAGTGRLSVALAQAGRAVTAIEPSAGMLRGLEKKAIDAGCRDRIQVVHACMHDCVCHPSVALDHDVAFCLFTSIHHVLTLESLELTMTAIARALKTGAIAFVGVHPRYVFEQFRGGMNQSVLIARLGGTVQWMQSAVAMQGKPHLLDTRCVLRLPDGREITDLLVTRAWTVEEITSAASRANLTADGTAGMIGTEEVLRFVKG